MLSTLQTFRLKHGLINLVVFLLCYQSSHYFAQIHHIKRHVAFDFEAYIPFVAWMIVPYLSSGLVLFGAFCLSKTRAQILTLSHRIMSCTVIACVIFCLFPLKFSFIKPAISQPFFAYLFDFLGTFDKPYNQLPSLHIAYCVVIWQSTKNAFAGFKRLNWALILMLIGVSTLFTYQHHLLDILAGLLLGFSVCYWITAPQTIEHDKGLNIADAKVGFYYFILASMVFIIGATFFNTFVTTYLTLSLSLISVIYYLNNAYFLGKKQGRHSWLSFLLFAPYLLGYWLSWLVVQFWERGKPALYPATQHIWVGRRLTQKQAQQLPDNCVIIDLSPELSESIQCAPQDYFYLPLLDLKSPNQAQLDAIFKVISEQIQQKKLIYIHCAMGYSRSKFIVQHYLQSQL